MLIRTIVMVALVAAPLAISPASASAQQRGKARAVAVQAQTTSAADACPSNMPPGIAKLMQQGGTLPPGLQGCVQAEPQPEPEPEPEPEPLPEEPADECEVTPHPFLPGYGIDSCTGATVPLG